MTGAQFARRLLKRCPLHVGIACGPINRYVPSERSVHLSPPVHDGKSMGALAVAAHEVAHGQQHAVMGGAWLLLLSRLEPFNFWLEWCAWTHAKELFCYEIAPDFSALGEFEDTRRAALLQDAARMGIQCAVGAVIVGVAYWLRA